MMWTAHAKTGQIGLLRTIVPVFARHPPLPVHGMRDKTCGEERMIQPTSSTWPHEMVITVESHEHRLCELLWVRNAYRLAPLDGEPPAVWPEPELPPAEVPSGAVRRQWGPLWLALWQEALNWYARADGDVDPELRARAMDDTVPVEDLLHEVEPRTWSQAVRDEHFDHAAFARWERDAVDLLLRAHRAGEQEEHALPALIAAWRRGLTRIVEIPTMGEYTRTLGADTLLVTAATRDDPDAYALALTAFRMAG